MPTVTRPASASPRPVTPTRPVTPRAANMSIVVRKPVTLPQEPSIMAQRPQDHIMLFFGPPGVGKTTFVNQLAPRVFFFSTDRGTRSVNTMRRECKTWQGFLDIVTALENPGAPKYDIACVDHVDDMAAMAEDAVCERLKVQDLSDVEGGWGKGWKALKLELRNFIRRLAALDMGIVFIAHEDIKEVKTRSIKLNRTMPAMPKTSWKIIVPLADIVGYCGYKTVKIQDSRKEVRVLETIPREDLYVKDRTLRIKPEKGWETLSGQKFIASFNGNKA